MRPDPGDDGFATVWVVIAIALVVLVGGLAATLGEVALARHRASAAADAAALTAALASIDGPAVACQRAADLAARNGARLTSCQLDGAIAAVVVALDLHGPLARFGSATGHARAGPANDH